MERLRRIALLAAAAALVALASGANAEPTGNEIVFGVTEGVTYQATPREIREKFEPIADVLAKGLRKTVKVVLVPAYDDARAGLARQEYDLAFIHPAHVSMAEIKAGRYRSVVWTSGFTEYTVSLLTKADRPLTDLKAIKGRTLVTPDPDSITAVMVRAMLRGEKLGEGDLRIRTTRYQDAVPFYLDNDFADVGATAASAVVRQWTDKGGKVGVKSRPVPIKQVIVSTRLPAEERERIRELLLGLQNSPEGRRALAACGYKGFVPVDDAVEKASIAWLGL